MFNAQVAEDRALRERNLSTELPVDCRSIQNLEGSFLSSRFSFRMPLQATVQCAKLIQGKRGAHFLSSFFLAAPSLSR